MKILLTGASGFLGNLLYNYFNKQDDLHTLGSTFADISIDLSKDTPTLNDQYDLVIHAAGKAHLRPKTSEQNKIFYDVNLQGTKNLLKGLNKNLPRQFVFISTVAVYGLSKGQNICEEHPLLATDPYGLSKIQAELFIKEWCEKNNIICTIFRLPLIVGLNAPGNLASMIKGIKNGYYFNIAGGKSKKSMILGTDIAKSIIPAAKIGGTYNLTDGFHPNFHELSITISSQFGKSQPRNLPYSIAKLLARFGDLFGKNAPFNTYKLKKITSDLTFDDTRARNTFGWNPTPVLQGLKISNK